MDRFSLKISLLIFLALSLIGTGSKALPRDGVNYTQPIIILTVDKVEGTELLECRYSAIRKFLEESACGLMSVRTGSGYNNTESGYLTLGSGNRSSAPPIKGGAFKPHEHMLSSKSGSFWKWSTGAELGKNNLVVPEIGWILNRAETEDLPLQPGLLGEIFRSNGWRTYLYSDQDSFAQPSRPGGYALMDQKGILDNGQVGVGINERDEAFPYRYRFNTEQVLNQLEQHLKPESLILVEFGDFARLERFRNDFLPERYLRLKAETWERLDYFIEALDRKWSAEQYRLVMLSPSLSRVGASRLAPIMIRGAGYPKGLLTSGTTSWEGLVANIDLLPTLTNMAGLELTSPVSGRTIRSIQSPNPLAQLKKLNVKISKINSVQRSLLDWYLWIISTGWLAVTLSILLKKRLGKGFLLVIVAILPLVMLIMPLTPTAFWQEGGLFILAIVLSLLLMKVKTTDGRYLILSISLWGGLILDQFTGWNLIRFSALGYSAVAGSRYYGIGNEYMGVFLAVSLVLSHLITEKFKCRWPVLLISGLSVMTLGWPQLGINFGGTLAALVGFSFYIVKLYRLKWQNYKIWLVFSVIILTVVLIGWWDSLRDPDLQTHLGRFFQLLIDLNLTHAWKTFSRKAAMNFKLIVYSAWTKTILLAAVITILNRITAKKMVDNSKNLLWEGILISGFTAFLVNDSGVVAFGTCLAYGFTYFLSQFEEREFSE